MSVWLNTSHMKKAPHWAGLGMVQAACGALWR